MSLHRLRTPLRYGTLLGALVTLSACGAFGSKTQDRPTVVAMAEQDAPAGDTPVAAPASVSTPAVAPSSGSGTSASPDRSAPGTTASPVGSGAAPAMGQPSAAQVNPPSASTVAELQRLIQAREVTELRTTYNGSYGASLLFKPDDVTYYVTLFQQKNFWRVVRTTSESQAESLFRAFVQESNSLAEVEMRRIKLQADYALSERLLSRRNEQLSTLQADQAIRVQQEQEVAQRQAEARSQAAELARQQADAKRELAELQKQIDALEAEQRRLQSSSASTSRRQR